MPLALACVACGMIWCGVTGGVFSPVPCKRRADPPPSSPAGMNGPPLLLRLVLPLLCLLLAELLRDRYADPKFMEGCVCVQERPRAPM